MAKIFSCPNSIFVELSREEISMVFLLLQGQNERSEHGCYICFADLVTGLPFRIECFGEMTEENAEACLKICQEKALRLARHPEHLCSAESRNDDAKQYPGAIRSRTAIISPSGMPWQLDEALALVLATIYDGMPDTMVPQITKLSGNTRFKEKFLSSFK